MPTGRAPKYQPLGDYLAAQPGDAVTLTLAAIEAILGAPLPASAATRGFWGNRRSVWGMPARARAWSAAGWRVRKVVLRSDRPAVTFVRARVDSTL